jgi:hypothetical protein
LLLRERTSKKGWVRDVILRVGREIGLTLAGGESPLEASRGVDVMKSPAIH